MIAQCKREKKGDEGCRACLANVKYLIKKVLAFNEISFTFCEATLQSGCVSPPKIEGLSL